MSEKRKLVFQPLTTLLPRLPWIKDCPLVAPESPLLPALNADVEDEDIWGVYGDELAARGHPAGAAINLMIAASSSDDFVPAAHAALNLCSGGIPMPPGFARHVKELPLMAGWGQGAQGQEQRNIPLLIHAAGRLRLTVGRYGGFFHLSFRQGEPDTHRGYSIQSVLPSPPPDLCRAADLCCAMGVSISRSNSVGAVGVWDAARTAHACRWSAPPIPEVALADERLLSILRAGGEMPPHQLARHQLAHRRGAPGDSRKVLAQLVAMRDRGLPLKMRPSGRGTRWTYDPQTVAVVDAIGDAMERG